MKRSEASLSNVDEEALAYQAGSKRAPNSKIWNGVNFEKVK